MNERLIELFRQSGGNVSVSENEILTYTDHFDPTKFAELIVRMCADYADMAQDAGCEYAGDYVAEAMGFGQEEGITAWRNKV